MSYGAIIAIAYTFVGLVGVAGAEEGDVKCPYAYDYHLNRVGHIAKPYFKCDFTSGTCERGFLGPSWRLFELLAPDRETIIAHYMCQGSRCQNFDTGMMETARGEFPLNPLFCDPQKFMRERYGFSNGSIDESTKSETLRRAREYFWRRALR